jgi:hypothetical protein
MEVIMLVGLVGETTVKIRSSRKVADGIYGDVSNQDKSSELIEYRALPQAF